MNVKIGTIDCTPEIDPYHRDTQGLTLTTLSIDPAKNTVSVTQEYDDNATPEPAWNGRIIERVLRSDGVLDADDTRKYLKSRDGQALLQRVVNGHSVDWNGNNHVGAMTSDAAAALESLVSELESCTSDVEIWTVEEYLRDCSEIMSDMTDDDVVKLADEIDSDDSVVILGDVREYIMERRSELRENS